MRKPDKRQRKGPKQGLTKAEQALVDRMKDGVKAMWSQLLARNKWRPIK